MKNKKNIILTIPLLLIFIWSSSKVIIYINEGIKNKNVMKELGIELTLEEPSDTVTPLEYTKSVMEKRKSAVESLKEINQDVVGWIYIYDTKIDYPILHCNDNSYYLNHNAEKNYSKYGSIFMDYRNTINDLNNDSTNVVLYGHKMKDKQMFGSLENFSDKDYFNSKYPIAIILNDKEYYFEAFSSYVTSMDDNYIQTNFNNEGEYSEFIEKISNKSHTLTNNNLESIDNVLTLSTCSYEFKDARLVVHAQLIEE